MKGLQSLEPRSLNLEYFFYHFFVGLRAFAEKLVLYSSWLDSWGVKFVSVVFTVIFLAWLFLYLMRLESLLQKKKNKFDSPVTKQAKPTKENKWSDIEMKVESANISDWKMAIIETDNLVDEIFKTMGKEGADFGERLKNIEPSDFENLQNVWDAHKIRNQIAHDANFNLTQLEAKEVIEKYRKALKELKYI